MQGTEASMAREARPAWHRVSARLGLLLLAGLCACAVQLVADPDAAACDQAIALGKSIDRFYGDLLETDAASRKYASYSTRYVELESELRSLVLRNKVRPLNAESTEIAQIILDKWLKYKAQHKAANTYSDGKAKLDRGRFQRLFTSALRAESAKELGAEDDDDPDPDEG
jgi:hypothetical protein